MDAILEVYLTMTDEDFFVTLMQESNEDLHVLGEEYPQLCDRATAVLALKLESIRATQNQAR